MNFNKNPFLRILVSVFIVLTVITAGAISCSALADSETVTEAQEDSGNVTECGQANCDSCDCKSIVECEQANCNCDSCDCKSIVDTKDVAKCSQANCDSCDC
ncbi:hypothetical protein RG963_10170, partial [Methanosarcina sp. Z-7115]